MSNESQQDVYFDKLTVKHYTGPLSQEQSYYPFGLQMAGISDKALLKQTNPYKFNSGTELEEDGGLNYYNTFYRKYDPQTGRFTGVDILAENNYNFTPYHYGLNDPIYFNDPSGAKEGQAADYSAFWEAFFQQVSDMFGPGVSFGGGGPSGQGAGGIGNYGAEFYHNSDGSWGVNEFTSESEAFTYGAVQAYSDGYWGRGQQAIDGYNHAQDVYEGITGENPGLMTPVTAVGKIWDYEGKTVINITNMDEVMRQLGKNGAYQWANYFDGAQIREGVNTSLELTDQIALRTINFGFKYGSYSKGLNVTEGISRVFAGVSLVNTIIDASENPNGLQTHNIIDAAAAVLTVIPGFGQAFGAFWFVSNIASELISGKSLSENIQDEWDAKE